MASCCSSSAVNSKTDSKVDPGVTLETKGLNQKVIRVAIALVFAGQSMIFGLGINMTPPEKGTAIYYLIHGLLILFAMIVFCLLGGPLVRETWAAIKERQFTLEGLFTLSIFGAFCGSLMATFTGLGAVYYEVISIVLVIYTFGKILGSRSRKRAIEASSQYELTFDSAYVLDKNNQRHATPIEKLDCCSQVSVGPGEAITVDGIILSGKSLINETAMTGELEPVLRKEGEYVYAGTYPLDGTLIIKPIGLKGHRKIDTLIRTLKQAKLKPSLLEQKADKIMQWFLPFVICIFLGTFTYWIRAGSWVEALFNSMSVLLVACPCALGLATPLAVWSALSKLSSMGLVSKTGEFLDALARANRIVFDKTGTLSESTWKVLDFEVAETFDKAFVGAFIRAIEMQMNHPVAKALASLPFETKNLSVKTSKVLSGLGVEATVTDLSDLNKNYRIVLGESVLMEDYHTNPFLAKSASLDYIKKTIYCSINGTTAAKIFLRELFPPNLAELFSMLKQLQLEITVLSGDASASWQPMPGVEYKGGLFPEEKETIINNFIQRKNEIIYVGDGINDAAAMAKSTASIAIIEGAALTQSTASALVFRSQLSVLPAAIQLARKIQKTIKGNMLFAACYNLIGMSLAATGVLHPVVAALLMLVSSLTVSFRTLQASKVLARTS